MRKIILGGIAVSATLGAMLATGASAGQPVSDSRTLCGVGTIGAANMEGASDQDHPDGSSFTANEEQGIVRCDDNNTSAGSDTWQILHSNVNVTTERGTEHGEYTLAGSSRAGGFNGHITDFDEPNGDDCTDGDRTIVYQSGKETTCTPSFGPVGNFNTHGGAQTGDHFRGNYGTLIYQENPTTATLNSPCPSGSNMYCIQVHLVGQTN